MKKLILLTFLILLLMLNSKSYSQTGWVYRNPFPQTDFYSIKFFNYNTGYVIGSGGTVLKTYTSDNNWINQQTNTSANLYASYFFDINTGYIAGDNGTLLYTSNGGNNWTNISSGTTNALRSITFVNNNTGFICGDNGTILKTINSGFNWTLSTPTAINLYCVFFIDLNTGYAGGTNGGFLKTTNSGSNWTINTVGPNTITSIFFTDNLNGYISEQFWHPFKTKDGGLTWSTILSPINGTIRSIKFANQFTGFAVGYQGPIFRTTNQGLSWYAWCSGQLFGNYSFTDISIIDTNTFFVAGEKGWLLKSVGTYLTQNSYNIGGLKSVLNDISFVNENTGCMMGQNLFLNTTNRGIKWNVSCVGSNSWFEASNYINGVMMFAPQSIYRIYYGPGHASPSSFSIERTTNNGISWDNNYGATGDFYGLCEINGISYLSDWEYFGGGVKIKKNSGTGWMNVYTSNTGSLGTISFANQNTGAVINNGTTKNIIRTSDGGNSWSIIPTGSTKYIYDIKLLPSGISYLAGDSSFFQRSTDFGYSWSSLPNQNIILSKVQFVNDNTGWLIGQTYGYPYTNRLFYTNNGGQNIIQIQSLGNFQPTGMSFINSLTGYVCGDSGIVLKTTDAGLTFINPSTNVTPDNFSLHQNYPNPFNPTTNIKFDLPKSGFVKLTIYDALGREVTTLVNEEMKAGSYNADWDASNYASGIFFYKLEAGDYIQTKKMVLIK